MHAHSHIRKRLLHLGIVILHQSYTARSSQTTLPRPQTPMATSSLLRGVGLGTVNRDGSLLRHVGLGIRL